MRRLAAFVKTTTVGGLFVLLPAVVFFVLAAKAVFGMRAAVKSIIEMAAGKNAAAVQFPVIYAALAVVAVSFLLGLAMIPSHGSLACTWLERKLVVRVPGYAAVRAIIGGFINAESEDIVRSAILKLGEGRECFAFITEDHGNGYLSVFVPGSPNVSSGSVQIVRKDLVTLLNIRMTDVATVLQQRGVEAAKVLAKGRANAVPNAHASLATS